MSDSVERALRMFEEQPPQAAPEVAAEAQRFAAVSERAAELFGFLPDEPADSVYIMSAGEGHIPARVFSYTLLTAFALRGAGVELHIADNIVSAQGNPTGFVTIHSSKRDANLAAEFLINSTVLGKDGEAKLMYFMMRALSGVCEIPMTALRPGTKDHYELIESLQRLPEDQRLDVLKRGFMTEVVIDELRKPLAEVANAYWQEYAVERQTAYRILYSQGFKPLGLEELMGLTKRAIDEECMDVPELGARLAAVRSRGRLN